MKYGILFLLLSTILFAGESIQIEKNKTFEELVETTTMQASISLNGKSKHETILEHAVSKVITIAQKGGCIGGKYRVRPNYIYDKNIQVMDGYYTQVTFKCEFSDTAVYQTVLDKIKKIKALTLTQGEISYFLSNEIKEKTVENLELKALQYATQYTKSLDKTLDEYKHCMISKVSFKEENFRGNYPQFRNVKMMSDQAEKTTVTNPIQNKENVSLQAYYTFECTLR